MKPTRPFRRVVLEPKNAFCVGNLAANRVLRHPIEFDTITYRSPP